MPKCVTKYAIYVIPPRKKNITQNLSMSNAGLENRTGIRAETAASKPQNRRYRRVNRFIVN
jgi:hypothetical protein